MRNINLFGAPLDELMGEFRNKIRQKRVELMTRDLPLYDFPDRHRMDPGSCKNSPALTVKPLSNSSGLDGDVYKLEDLLQYEDGNRFINSAYRCILKREPDSHGYDFYLQNLLQGNMTRVEILGCLRYSREGRARRTKIKGLFWRLCALKLRFVVFSALVGRWIKKFADHHLTSDIRSDCHKINSELSHLKEKFQQVEELIENHTSKIHQELSEFRRLAASLVNESAIEIDRLEAEFRSQQAKLFNLLERQKTAVGDLRRSLQENQMKFSQLRRQINPLLEERKKHTLSGSINGEFFEGQFDYLGFENRLRGSEEMVREHHRTYLKYFQGKDLVLDIGCGRGEFLELLRAAGIAGQGVDLSPDMVRHCREKGLEVAEADALAYLQSLPDDSLGAVFCSQLVEHLTTEDMLALVKTTHQKLQTGGILLIETLNPESLFVIYRWFWIDPTHIRLVHPETLKFILESTGFSDVVLQILPPNEGPILLPLLSEGSFAENELANFNLATQYLNNLLYAGFDYAIIGTK